MPDGSGIVRMTPHRFPGQRAIHLLIRTAHIASAGIVLGAVTFGIEPGPWGPAAAASGLLLLSDDLFRYRLDWFRFVQSWVILAKLAVLWVALLVPAIAAPALWFAVIAGGIISHAPGRIRQAAMWGEPGPCAQKHSTKPHLPIQGASTCSPAA